jgi:hypothetical protein
MSRHCEKHHFSWAMGVLSTRREICDEAFSAHPCIRDRRPAFAAGTASYITSRVTISGPYDWGALQPSTLYQNAYGISASSSPLAGVGITGDPQFTIDGSACPGVRSCLAPV